jgi:hypothetical protein
MAVVLARRRCGLALGGIEQRQRFTRAADRRLAQLIGMGKARHLARNTAQAKSGGGGIIRRLQPAIIKAERFGGAILEIEFPIVASGKQLRGQAARGFGVKPVRAVQERAGITGHAPYIGAQIRLPIGS